MMQQKEKLVKKLSFNKSKLQTAYHMVLGAFTLIIASLIFWIFVNMDVFIKSMRYPEAVRQLNIEIQVVQNENGKE